MKAFFIFILIVNFVASERPDCNKWEGEITTDDLMRVINLHNEKRNLIATGEISKGIPDNLRAEKFPFATNMLQMYWNHKLAEKAQEIANRCKFEHSDVTERVVSSYPVGENLAQEYQNNFQPEMNWSRAIEVWWKQHSTYLKDGGSVDYFKKKSVEKSGSFSQMIWANTFMVGCGFAQYREESKYYNLYVCHYGPIGNIVNLPVYYSSAFRLNRCPPGTEPNKQNFKGLCCPFRGDYCEKYVYAEDELIENTVPQVVKNIFQNKMNNRLK